MPEDKIRVSARIPKELYDSCLQRYDNITNAINAGLELLRAQCEDTCQTNEDKRQQSEDGRRQDEDERQTSEDSNRQPEVQELKARLEDKDRVIKTLEERLSKAPDHVEFAEVRAHFEGLQKLLEEKQERIKDLTQEVDDKRKEVERLDMFAHYFKSVEVKQIEAPAAERKKRFWEFWK